MPFYTERKLKFDCLKRTYGRYIKFEQEEPTTAR